MWSVAAIAAASLVPAATSAAGTANACSRFEAVTAGGTIAEPKVVELSGLAGSRGHSDVLWGHNDSGGAPELYAFAEDGSGLGTYPVEGAEAVDWEDIATGPGPDGVTDVLFIGDIGDNGAERRTVTVYRVHEPGETPVAPGVPLTEVDAIELAYPRGPSDAEALLVDPRTGDLVIVTKSLSGASRVLVAAASSLVSGTTVTMTDAGGLRVPISPERGSGLPGTMVTGGDVSPDGSLVVLRTYRSVLVFERGDDQTLAEALLGEPCFGPQAEEPQGEAIAFTGDGTAYVTASEGTNVPIHRVRLTQPAPTTTTTTTTITTAVEAADDDVADDDDTTVVAALIGGAVVLLVLGGAAVYVARRRRASGVG